MTRTTLQWTDILTRCGVRATTAARWAPVFAAEIQPGTFSAGDAEIDDFLGQVLHESQMLERLEEGLFYTTPERLCAVWPSRFKTPADAKPFTRNPQALANKVYGGRMGNTGPNDGWLCRGSGLIQVTGMDNLRAVAAVIGWAGDPRDLADRLRTDPATALRASILWWEGKIPDGVMGDVVRITKLVNGGTNGLDDRRRLADLARKVLA